MDDRLAGYLTTRRSIPALQLGAPGPDAGAIKAMLTIAARVPDHGKLAPWRFVLYSGDKQAEATAGLGRIAESSADEAERRMRTEKAKTFAAAPLVIGVISTADPAHPKIPLWEQELSAGAVCLNLVHAAAAYGFAAQWLTGWYAYDDAATAWLGVKPGERVAGFVHIGTPQMPPSERDRPDLETLVSEWKPG